MLVANVAERATAKSLTEVIRVLAVPILVAIVAERATAKSLTEVILVLLLLILVAIVALTAASSASVAKPEPSPITELIDVIASRLVFVNTDTAATSVTFAAETPAIRSSSASILVAETIPKD